MPTEVLPETSPFGAQSDKIHADEWDDGLSVDTNDAFMDMLGFSSENPMCLDVAETEEYVEPSKLMKQLPTSCEPIKVPLKCSRGRLDPTDCLALVMDNVLTENECLQIIEMAGTSFRYITEATHKTADGASYTVEIQNPNPHKLSAIDTDHNPQYSAVMDKVKDTGTVLMDKLYDEISASLSSQPSYQSYRDRTTCGSMQGLNPRMRVLKYDADDNDRFDAHFDATTVVPGKIRKRQSLITVLVYLNNGDGDDFEGGETHYFQQPAPGANVDHGSAVKVVPKTGRVVLFEHDLFHSGAPLDWGTKYVMRTDVLFDIQDTNEGNVVTNEGEGDQKSALVSDICNDLNFNSDAMQTLKNMDLFDITCDALMAPGAKIIETMLIDCGLSLDCVKQLINKATSILEG